MKTLGAVLRLLFMLLLPVAWPVQAADWPTRPVTLVVPTAAGGFLDAVGRALAQGLGKELKQQVVVFNAPGGGGNVSVTRLLNATPDGYTLLLFSSMHTINPSLRPVPYDPATSFRYIGYLPNGGANVMVGKPGGATSVRGLVEAARKTPGRLTYGSPGVGSTSHLGMEMFGMQSGSQFLHVPSSGGASSMLIELSTGVIDVDILPLAGVTEEFIRTGKAVGLAVSGEQRVTTLPNVPTFAEAGYPKMLMRSWAGLVGPAAMPAEAVRRMEQAFMRLMEDGEVREALARQSFESKVESGQAMSGFAQSEVERWRAVIQTANIKVD